MCYYLLVNIQKLFNTKSIDLVWSTYFTFRKLLNFYFNLTASVMISSYMLSHLHFLWPHWSILHFYNVQYFRIKYRSKIFYCLLHWVLHNFAWFFPQSIQTIVFGCFQQPVLSTLVTSFITLLNFVGFSFNSSFISLMTSWRSLFFTNYFFFAPVLLLQLCYMSS